MSEALERVIAEQQKEIDWLKERDLKNIEAWKSYHKRVDDFVRAVFELMDGATPAASRSRVIDAVRALGYCTYCECNPCECDE